MTRANRQIPLGNQEIIQLALMRCLDAKRQAEDPLAYVVSFAEGLIEKDGSLFATSWCVIMLNTETRFAQSGLFLLPNKLKKLYQKDALSEEELEKFLFERDKDIFEKAIKQALSDKQ